MPRAWPFIQAGLFPGRSGISKRNLRPLEQTGKRSAAGRRIFRMLLALGFIELALIADKLGWIPSFGRVALAGIPVEVLDPDRCITIVLCLGPGRALRDSDAGTWAGSS